MHWFNNAELIIEIFIYIDRICTENRKDCFILCIYIHIFLQNFFFYFFYCYFLQVKDCNVLASKLLFILDDLLWVLTDSQLKAVIHYAKSLSEAMEKSTQQRKSMEVCD